MQMKSAQRPKERRENKRQTNSKLICIE